MYKRDIPKTYCEEQAVQRRQRLDEERKKRIFDPKIRTIGIDVKGIEEQIRIKRETEEIERERNQKFDASSALNNATLQLLDAHAEATRRSKNMAVEAFRREQQQKHTQRDFDLYDPEALKKDKPARESDYDQRNSVSGLQRFEGEDLMNINRIQTQKHEMRAWVNDAMKEKHNRHRYERMCQRAADKEVLNNHERLLYLCTQEKNEKRQRNVDDKEFNKMLSQERQRRMAEERRNTLLQNNAEISGLCEGDLLTERRAPPQLGPHSLRIDAFKGMTEEQIAEIRRVRERQIYNAIERHRKQNHEDIEWAKHGYIASRTAALLERQQKRDTRANKMQMASENQQLAHEFRSRRDFIEKIEYTNPPTEDYFSQFNTTSR